MIWKKIFIVFISFSSILKFLAESKVANHIISSPKVTNWGPWGKLEFCQKGMFVRGMRLKVEPAQCGGDNTGLNGVSFLCDGNKLRGSTFDKYPHNIESEVGEWGNWGLNYTCRKGYVVGFQLRSQRNQGYQDDFGATNLRIICSSGEVIEGNGLDWGDWTQCQMCPPGYAICGIQTQVEAVQGDKSDDASLNNLKAQCCNINA